MPSKNLPPKVSDAENRLRVLSCLDVLGMVTLEQLWPFMAKLELMEYMSLCIYVSELTAEGELVTGTGMLNGALSVTEKGHRTLALHTGEMAKGVTEAIQAAAPAYLLQLSEDQQVSAVYERAETGCYRVACTIREGDMPTLFMRVLTRQRRIASDIMTNFRACASGLMMTLYTLSTSGRMLGTSPVKLRNTTDAAIEAALAGDRAICALSQHEYYAVVALREKEATLVLMLLTPSQESAESWSAAAVASGKQLAQTLSELLHTDIQ